MEVRFNTGDVVRLKSSAQLMTVSEIKGEIFEQITCMWFDNDHHLQTQTFTKWILEKV